MIQLIHQPYNLVRLCISMIFNGNLHTIFFNQRNGCLEFVIANQHLLHNIRMHFTAKQIFWTNNIQAEFYQLCIQIMTNAQRFFYGTIYTGITACIERRVELQEQPAFLCICRDFMQIFCAERVILCGCQQIHLCNLQTVQFPFHTFVHQFIQGHHLIKEIVLAKAPAFSEPEEMQRIRVHANPNWSVNCLFHLSAS